MRDYNLTYIPDLTERYPEGFGGVDMTPGCYDDPLFVPKKSIEEEEEERHDSLCCMFMDKYGLTLQQAEIATEYVMDRFYDVYDAYQMVMGVR